MTGRVPLIPTILVVAAIALMIALGFWQLDRRDEKEAMIAAYRAVPANAPAVAYPRRQSEIAPALYRRSSVVCERVLSTRSTAQRDRRGNSGLAQVARCALAGGGTTEIVLGFTSRPQPVDWEGGAIAGTVAPAGDGVKLVADPPAFSLAPLPKPDPGELPNNHLAYAGQWFFFALTALVIYSLALRRRRKAASPA